MRPGTEPPLPSETDDEVLLRQPKTLYRLLERVFAAVDDRHGGRRLLAWCLREFFGAFRDDLGLHGIWLYSAQRNRFHLVEHVGERDHPPPEVLDGSRPEMLAISEGGLVSTRTQDEARSPSRLGVTGRRPAAALWIAEPRYRHVVFMSFAHASEPAAVEFVLRTLRSVLSARILQNRWGDSLREAAEIQRGLLPKKAPTLPGYDIAARSQPAEDVGGDLYDFLPVEPTTHGIAIADASGHGLGAALVARDVSVGLRMGAQPETKVTHLLTQLNRVVHAAGLANSFVSAFYGELDTDGNMIYVNAGHPPPALLHGGAAHELEPGNVVLGPQPDARFRRRFARLEPGATLVLYTDGIIERQSPAGDLFEVRRLQTAALDAADGSAEQVIDAVFAAAHRFGGDLPWDDDATLVVVKRDQLSSR